MATRLVKLIQFSPFSSSQKKPCSLKPAHCSPLQQTQQQEGQGVGVMCEGCSGKGWVLCDFCNGQKTNVKAANSRIYRRCPSCRAIGHLLCSKCKVYKCVSFPDYSDDIHGL